jgi:hypothetical protein
MALDWAFLTYFDRPAHTGIEAIGPGRFDQDTSGVFVTGFGDRALATRVTGGELRRDQSQVLHEGFRVGKARQIAELSDECDGGNEVNPAQTHQSLDHPLQRHCSHCSRRAWVSRSTRS